MRVIGKPIDGVADHCSYPSACGRILSDVPPDPFEIVQCCSAPNDLPAVIKRFVAQANDTPKPFVWTADRDKIIAAVRRRAKR